MGRVTARILESAARRYERRADRIRGPVRAAALRTRAVELRSRAVDERRAPAAPANGSSEVTQPIPVLGRESSPVPEHHRGYRSGHSAAAVLICSVGILGVLLVAVLTGDTSGARTSTSASTSADGDGIDPGRATPVPDGDALAALDELDVMGRARLIGYDRSKFPHWSTEDGCDTRAAILERDARPGSAIRDRDGCVVGAGVRDPYTAQRLDKETGSGSQVEVDHVVALAEAWRSGAQLLDRDKREEFANDSLNLLAVDGDLDREKGDSNAASWLPPNEATQCDFVARQVAVKAEYGLWVTSAERDAIARVLGGCPGQPLPTA